MTEDEFKAAMARLRESGKRWALAHPRATMPLPPPDPKEPPPHFADTERDEDEESEP